MLKKMIVCLFGFIILFAHEVQADIIINEINLGEDDYIELFNYSPTAIDIAGYELNIRDSGFGNFDFTLPSRIINPNSGVVIVAEAPQPGEIDAGQNIPWNYDRDLSLTLRDASNTVIDFWAHGTSLFGAPAGVTFTPAPLQLISGSSDAITYQRMGVTTVGTNFFAADWISGTASRNAENAQQIYFEDVTVTPIPTLNEWGIIIFSLLLGSIAIWYIHTKGHGGSMA